MTPPKVNNFDLVRLIAATQVAVHHGSVHLGVDHSDSLFFQLSSLFPGVPIFFFISGFLISSSFERNPQLALYAQNRLLRIYPALIVCFAVSLLSVYLSGYFSRIEVEAGAMIRWVAAQISIVQFYNPDFMRQYGVGVLNGSLWTIVVELQFYLLIPLLYATLLAGRWTARAQQMLIAALLLVFLAVNQAYVNAGSGYGDALWYKLVGVSFAPWVYMFIAGIICQRNYALVHRILAGRFVAVLAAYIVLALAAREWLGWRFGNTLNPATFAGLAAVTFAAAFTANSLSDRVLRRNDISYGMYIYHMPVVNGLVAAGFIGTAGTLASALALTTVLAFASWRLVERPALSLKRKALYRHSTQSQAAGSGATASQSKPVVLFVGAFPPPQSKVYGGMVTSCRALLKSSLPDRVRLHLVDSTQKSNPPPPLVVRLRHAVVRFARYLREFEKHRPDAVMLFVSTGASVLEKGAMAWYARLRGRPAILFPRSGAIVDAGEASAAYRRLLRLCLGGGRMLVCQSDAWRQFAIDRLRYRPGDVAIIRNWTATPDLLKLGADRSHRAVKPVRLIFVGWVERKKGILDLLQSCGQINEGRDIHLTVVGDGHAMEEARVAASRQDLKALVTFTGWLEAPAVAQALAQADVFVLPSWAEGLPNALVEAMAAGLAVVVTEVGAIPDFVINGHSGLTVPAGDTAALAKALAQVVDDPALRASLAAEGHRVAAREFGAERAAASILQVVNKVVADGTPARQ